MTLVLGPIHWVAARSAPRAAILPARTAMACVVGAEGFMVTILPLRRTRSAGWAWRHAAKAAMRTGTDTRMEFRIQKISGHGARVAKRAFLEWGWRSGESDFDAETRRKAREARKSKKEGARRLRRDVAFVRRGWVSGRERLRLRRYATLLLAEGVHGVETGGAAGGQIAGGGGEEQEQGGGGEEQRAVGRGEGEEHGAEGSGGANGSSGAEQRAYESEQRDIAHHQAGHGGAFGAEGETDADLPGAEMHCVGDDTVDADSGQGEGKEAETGGKEGQEFLVA